MKAIDFLNENHYHVVLDTRDCINTYDIADAMREFAKYHVEQALIAAVDNVEVDIDSSGVFQGINNDSILKAYSLTNIE